MVHYPKCKQKLPELFEEIVNQDNYVRAIKTDKIIYLEELTEAKKRLKELTDAAGNRYRRTTPTNQTTA